MRTYECLSILEMSGKIMALFSTSSWQRVLHSIISTRILLHVRGVLNRTVDTEVFELGIRSSNQTLNTEPVDLRRTVVSLEM